MNTSRNSSVIVNGRSFYATDISYDTETQITPLYIGQRKTNDFAVTDYGKRSITINYFLTGEDLFLDNLSSYDTYYSGECAGILFHTGFLSSYSVRIAPNESIQASATITSFDATGRLRETPVRSLFTGYLLNSSDITISHTTGVDFNELDPKEIIYQYNCDINPVRHAGTIVPYQFSFGPTVSNIDIVTDSITGNQNLSGEFTNFDILFNTHLGQQVASLNIQGPIYKKAISFSPSEYANNTYSIIQTNVTSVPYVSGFGVYSGYCNEYILATGANLDEITQVKLNTKIITDWYTTNSNELYFKIVCDEISGNVCFNNDQCFGFNVLDSGIFISGFTPISGSYYDSRYSFIDIYGTGFFGVDSVLFGSDFAAKYDLLNDGHIRAWVPQYAVWEKITLVASYRNKNAVSDYEFVPIPYPLGYYADYRILGDKIHFYGDHFSGVTGVMFNGINYPSYSLDKEMSLTYKFGLEDGITGITADTVSGYNRGYVTFFTRSGLAVNTSFIFEPNIYITGLSQTQSVTGATLEITGLYLVPELMRDTNPTAPYYPDTETFYVTIGASEPTLFTRQPGAIILSGVVPVDATTGPVKIKANTILGTGPDFIWSGIYTVLASTPDILYCDPYTIYYPDETRAYGTNFFNVISVEYLQGTGVPTTGFVGGYQVSNDGTQISIPSTGIPDYVPGFDYSNVYGLRVVTESGEDTLISGFRINDTRTPGSGAYQNFVITGFLTGSSGNQACLSLSNYTDYDSIFTFPGYTGYNWYGTGYVYGDGLAKNYYNYTGTTGTVCLSIENVVSYNTLTGTFTTDDGYTEIFTVVVLPYDPFGCNPVSNVQIYSGGSYPPDTQYWTVVGGTASDSGNNAIVSGSITELYIHAPAPTLDGNIDLSPISSCIEKFGSSQGGFTFTDTLLPNLIWLLGDYWGITSFTAGTNYPSLERYACQNSTSVLSIDLSNQANLTLALGAACSNLTTVDISNSPLLTTVNFHFCALDQTSVDNILLELDANGLSNGQLTLQGGTNAAPSGAAITAKANLISKGWAVYTN